MLMAAGNLDAARQELERILSANPDNAKAWYLLGKVIWRTGDRSRAMSCYSKAVALDADSPAAYALEQARDIANFFNPDLLNP